MATLAQTVIFLHIPKTGGATLHKILEKNYRRNEILTFDGSRHRSEVERFAKLLAAQRGRYRLIKGHLFFGLHEFVPGNSTYVTFLREPIDRGLSFYSHARSRSDHYLYRLVTREKLDLTTLLERRATPELVNHQTRLIAGESDLQRPVDRHSLERAKRNLQSHFSFVGIMEEFDAGLVLLSRVLGQSLSRYRKSNVSREKIRAENIDKKTREALHDANALDLELYEFARALFASRRKAAGEVFENEVRDFRRLNRNDVACA